VKNEVKGEVRGEGRSDMKNDMKSGLKSEARGGSLSDAHTLEPTALGPNSSTSSTSHTLQTCTSSASTEGLTSAATYTFTSSSTSTTSTSTSSTSSCAVSGVGGDEGMIKTATPTLPLPLPLSTAAAAIASFSSTTGWIRDEVRRRGQPATAQTVTSPAPSASGSGSGSLSIGSVLSPHHSKADILKADSLTEGTKAETDADSTSTSAGAGAAVISDGIRADENNDMSVRNNKTINDDVLQRVNNSDETKKHEKHEKHDKHEKHEKGVSNHVEVGKDGSVSGAAEHTFFHSFLHNGSIPHFLNRKSHSQSHSQSQSSSQHLSALSPESHSPDSSRIKAFSLISDLKAQSLESLADSLLGPRSDSGIVKNSANAAESSNGSHGNSGNKNGANGSNDGNNNGSHGNNGNKNGANGSNDGNYNGSHGNNGNNNGNNSNHHNNDDSDKNNNDNNNNINKSNSKNNNNNNHNTALSSSNTAPLENDTISIKKCNGFNALSLIEESVALHGLSGNAGIEECNRLSPLPVPMSMPVPTTPSALDAAPPNPFLSSPSMIISTPTHTPVLTPPGSRIPGPTPYTALSYDSDTATISLPLPLTLSTPSHDGRDILLTPSSSPPTVLTPISALSTPPSLSQEMSASSNIKAQQQQQQQQQQQKVLEREEKTHPSKEKDKHLEKSEWFNKLGEAKEKLQNKFSVFKSKLVHLPGSTLSPSTHSHIPTTSLSDILLPKLADTAVVSVKPATATARTSSTADPQQPVTYKSALPELLISAMSSLASPSPSPSHHSASKVPWVSTGISNSTTHDMGSLIESGTAGGGEGEGSEGGVGEVDTSPRKNMSSFSPIPKPISDPILRARSTSDATSHSMRPESDPLGRSRNRRALSVGTFESAFSAQKASELSHSARGKNPYTKGSFKATLKATTTPQERRYNMYKHFEMSLADRETEEGLEELIIPTPFSAVSKFGMLSSDAKLISLCGSEMSPNAAVMMYEQQLTNTERSESSFSPGDHSAPALSRMGVLWAPPYTERMWAELSIGGKFGKASLQLYFVGDKSSQGMDADESRKTVSFVDHTEVDRVATGAFDGSTGTGSSSSSNNNSSNSNNSSSSSGSSSIASGAGVGAGAGVQASKMVLAASYDLQEAECRQLTRPQSAEMVSGQAEAEGSQSSEPHTAAAGFEILLHTDRKKWIAFMCPSEEDCDDWMDAIDNVAHV
jgi:hypothetical protein